MVELRDVFVFEISLRFMILRLHSASQSVLKRIILKTLKRPVVWTFKEHSMDDYKLLDEKDFLISFIQNFGAFLICIRYQKQFAE